MKKLLVIILLSLLLNSNTYAASKYFYLSCPSFISKNDSKGKHKDSVAFKPGTYVGHTLLRFKHTKKKYTKFPTYLMGYAVPPRSEVIWKIIPPQKLPGADFMYTSGKYVFVAGEDGMEFGMILTPFGIDTDKKEFNLKNKIELPSEGISFYTTSNWRPDNEERCETLDKKEFNKIIKEGIK